ncbi:DUF2807 domain-containing protein [Myxococcaceae bacterium GXIMD 01537]
MRASNSQLLLMLSLLSLSGCAHGSGSFLGTRGNGSVSTRAVRLDAFDAVRVEGSIDVLIEEGDTPLAEVTVDDNLQGLVRLEVRDGTLVIDNERLRSPSDRSRVRLVMPRLRAVSAEGSSDVRVQPRGRATEQLALDLSGSGNLVYKGDAGRLALSLSGSGDLRYEGMAESLEADLSGSGNLGVRGGARRLEVRTSGTGDVEVSGGEAERLVADLSGTGDLDARQLPARDVSVASSGTGNARVQVAGGTAQLRASGTGDIDWWGKAASTRIHSSGPGDVVGHD